MSRGSWLTIRFDGKTGSFEILGGRDEGQIQGCPQAKVTKQSELVEFPDCLDVTLFAKPKAAFKPIVESLVQPIGINVWQTSL